MFGNIFKSETKLVAVYGSLRKGLGNHPVMRDSKYISHGKSVEQFTLTDYCRGGFPALDKTVPTHNVVVEVYEVISERTADGIDGLEGYPSFYDRSIIEVELDDGSIVKAWTYDIAGVADSCPAVPDGDWMKLKEELHGKTFNT